MDRIIYLIARQLTKEATVLETKELEQLLSEDESLNQLYKAVFAKKASESEADWLDVSQAYATHYVKMQLNNQFSSNLDNDESNVATIRHLKKTSWRRKFFSYGLAASVLLLLSIVSFIFITKRDAVPVSKGSEIVTKKGSKSRVVLPDGTLVWLNADSKLIYPENFQGTTREVRLTGEAFFDVTEDSNRPFIIHTNTIEVKVLGTIFNLRSYPEEATTETSLLDGMIEVTLLKQADKKIILRPNEKLTISNDETENIELEKDAKIETEQPVMILSKVHYRNNDTISTEALWVNNILAFDNEGMDNVFFKIERWYNVEIEVKNQELLSKHFTATFQNKPLEEIMQALQFTFHFNYKIEGGKVIISK
jgi:ferric-dicitrate binding protein FerR (iron transport regulator)